MLNKAKNFFVRLGNKNERQIMFNHRDENGHGYQYDEHGKRLYFAPALRNHDWTEVQDALTRDGAKQWVADLRSGEFEQTAFALCNAAHSDHEVSPGVIELETTYSYCCLGVLAREDIDYEAQYGPRRNNLKGDLKSFGEDDPYVYWYDYLPRNLQERYQHLNDTAGYDFDEIADEIEKEFNLG